MSWALTQTLKGAMNMVNLISSLERHFKQNIQKNSYMLSLVIEKEGSDNQDLSCISYLSSLLFQTHEEKKPQLLNGKESNKREKPAWLAWLNG